MANKDQENKKYFDQWARSYDQDRLSPWFQFTQRLAMNFLNLKRGATLLDVGCGTGFAVREFAGMVNEGKGFGIDISLSMIEEANSKVSAELRKHVQFLQASSENIPYKSDSFDYVICTNSFHHYPDPVRCLVEMRRVLRPCGQLVILENARDLSPYTWLWDRILRIMEKGHVRYYSSEELEVLLSRSGFKKIELCYLQNEFFKRGKLFASLQVWSAYAP